MVDNDIIQILTNGGACVFDFLLHQFSGEDEVQEVYRQRYDDSLI